MGDPLLLINSKVSRLFVSVYWWLRLSRDPMMLLNFIFSMLFVSKF